MRSIVTTIQIDDLDDGRIGVSVQTKPFDTAEMSDEAGTMWVGICTAINQYLRARGMGDFNCLTLHPANPAARN